MRATFVQPNAPRTWVHFQRRTPRPRHDDVIEIIGARSRKAPIRSKEAAVGLRIVVAADSAGIEYKEVLKKDLEADPRVDEVIDAGLAPG